MIVEQVVPRPGRLEVEEVLRRLREAPRDCADPFRSARIDFTAEVSRAIFDHPPARAYPELLAAAFWLRRAEVSRLAQQFSDLEQWGRRALLGGLHFTCHRPTSTPCSFTR